MPDKFNIPSKIESLTSKEVLITRAETTASQLIRAFNMQNVQIIQPVKETYLIDKTSNADPQLYLSALGTPVLVDLTFEAARYQDENGSDFAFDKFRLETVLLSISQAKNIVKTTIQGRKGTVKEYIGLGDYQVTIYGIITGLNGQYPKQDVQTLKKILTAPIPLTVTSWYLQMWDINTLVVDGFDCNQDEGRYSSQPFVANCSSDEEVILRYQ